MEEESVFAPERESWHRIHQRTDTPHQPLCESYKVEKCSSYSDAYIYTIDVTKALHEIKG